MRPYPQGYRASIGSPFNTYDALKDVILANYGKTKYECFQFDIVLVLVQQKQIAEIEAQARGLSRMTAKTTKTANIHGEQIIVTTVTQYEAATFHSKTDWRVHVISATNLHLYTKHIHVNS